MKVNHLYVCKVMVLVYFHVLLVYIVYVRQSTYLHCSLTTPSLITTTGAHDDTNIYREKYFDLETSAVLNYLPQIF